MAVRKRSPVWEFFELDGEQVKKTVCKLCDVKLAWKGGTTNLINHLQAKHDDEYKRAFIGSSSELKKQTTLSSFQTKLPLLLLLLINFLC